MALNFAPAFVLAEDFATTTEPGVSAGILDGLSGGGVLAMATSTEEENPNDKIQMSNEFSNDQILNENATGTEAMATTTEEMATTTEEVFVNDQNLTINDCARATSTQEVANSTTTEELANTTSTSEIADMATTTAPLALMVNFNDLDYGPVAEDVIAPGQTNSLAMITNSGTLPARISLWQDDMGLGNVDGVHNIYYGARINGGDWLIYAPFETAVLPEVLAPGQNAKMEFLVVVINYPKTIGQTSLDYRGQMKIDAVAAELPPSPEPVIPDDVDLKPETTPIDLTATTTTETPDL